MIENFAHFSHRSIASNGHGYVYVLPVAGPEDLLKIGGTGDPLARWSSFHPRWFEAFDLPRSALVETETRRDAQRLETQWHRQLREHRCPMPITMRTTAGGGSEWYRGAYARIEELLGQCRAQGHTIHTDARALLASRMHEQQARLFELLAKAASDYYAGWLSPAQRSALRDLLDAHRLFDATLGERLPQNTLSDLGLDA